MNFTFREKLKQVYVQNIREGYTEDAPFIRLRASGNFIIVSEGVSGCAVSRGANLCDRGNIRSMSHGSAQRMRAYLRECTADYRNMVTLTYPAGHGYIGGQCKRDLKVFMQRVGRYLQARGTNPRCESTFWFMEFQKRGAIHFHLFTTWDIEKLVLSKIWYEVAGTDDVRHLYAGTRVERLRSGMDGARSYAAKYAAKSVQKIVPENFGWTGRFWGVFGSRNTVSADTLLSHKTIKNPEIKEQFDELLTLMAQADKENGVIYKESMVYQGFVAIVKDKKLARNIRFRINMIRMTQALIGEGTGTIGFGKELLRNVAFDEPEYEPLEAGVWKS